jgi:hypothetical protein
MTPADAVHRVIAQSDRKNGDAGGWPASLQVRTAAYLYLLSISQTFF